VLKLVRKTVLGTLLIGLLSCAPSLTSKDPDTVNILIGQEVLRSYPTFQDAKPHEGIGDKPQNFAVHGIDASRWQSDIDWQTARSAGISFAYIKATEGGDVFDPMFLAHWNGAQKAGVRQGAYHYFYFCRPAIEQARWFISHVPREAKALPHVLDMEWNHLSRTCPLRPTGAKVREEAKRFLDILEKHYGQRPIIYTTVDFYRDTNIEQLKNTQFWLRSVAAHPRKTYPGQKWTFWQYTGTGIVPGVPTPVDINVFAGTLKEWRNWPD